MLWGAVHGKGPSLLLFITATCRGVLNESKDWDSCSYPSVGWSPRSTSLLPALLCVRADSFHWCLGQLAVSWLRKKRALLMLCHVCCCEVLV